MTTRRSGSYHTRSGPPPWVLGFTGRSFPAPLGAAIRAGQISGLILFRDNLGDSVAEALALREEILSYVPSGNSFLLMADEEGGLIHPTAGLALGDGTRWAAVPSPSALGRLGRAADARFVGSVLGARLRALGVHVTLAPLLDLDTHPENGVIGTRSFGADPALVARMGWAFSRGLMAGRTWSCFKHYPGHGGTTTDSHATLPIMDPKLRSLHEKPFVECLRRATSERPWLMTSHVDWGDGLPVSLSRAVVSRITRRAGPTLIITDSLDMGAVSLQAGAAEQALLAHNDILLVARDWRSGLKSVTQLEARVAQDPAALAALVRARSRIRETWNTLGRRRRAGGELAETAAVSRQLGKLHRLTVRLEGDPATLPKGGWIWILPSALRPYTVLRDWIPPAGKRRFCEEVVWVDDPEAGLSSAEMDRLSGDPRPKLLATLFRGVPPARIRERWDALSAIPGIEVIAHLLDGLWPGSSGARIAFASTPHAEGLTGLAEALDLAKTGWAARDGAHFPVDS